MRLPSPRQTFRDARDLWGVYRGGPLPRTSSRGAEAPTVAVILGAQVLRGARPSGTLDARVRHAVRLYQEGRIELLIPTGGLGEHPPSEAEVMARILRSEGVPDSTVLIEDKALNTWDSALLVSKMARRLGIDSVFVVTDPLHCIRTVASFAEAGLEAWPEPAYSSPMWRKRLSRTGQLARETGALVWYRTRHGVGSRSRR